MKILVLNCGSSSLKYKLFAAADLRPLAAGEAERLSHADDYRAALAQAFEALAAKGMLKDKRELMAVAHRVVHGGEEFRGPTLLDADALAALRRLIPLAPLHNPANLLGVELTRELCPGVPQVAVFDTAFHHSLPPHAYHYALPAWAYREEQVRRYGFHGSSVSYVSRRAAQLLDKSPAALNLIVLHLGNGASVTAVKHGRSIDTSMGMTPLEGLIMGTRSGDLDAAVPFYLMRQRQLTAAQMEELLFHGSGLLGLAGAADMREVQARAAAGDEEAALALEMVGYRLKKYLGAYTAVLGRVDALVFTAGIGEHDPDIRARACRELGHLGMVLDDERNAETVGEIRDIAADHSTVRILVIPTDEEWEIAYTTIDFLRHGGKGAPHDRHPHPA
jgi:acetate kinase